MNYTVRRRLSAALRVLQGKPTAYGVRLYFSGTIGAKTATFYNCEMIGGPVPRDRALFTSADLQGNLDNPEEPEKWNEFREWWINGERLAP